MTVLAQVTAEVARLDAVLAKRGQWYEDEEVRRRAMADVLGWMADERKPVPEPEPELVGVGAPADKTKDLFASYRDKLKKEGKMR